jgi:hypothetical protein
MSALSREPRTLTSVLVVSRGHPFVHPHACVCRRCPGQDLSSDRWSCLRRGRWRRIRRPRTHREPYVGCRRCLGAHQLCGLRFLV